MNEFAEFMLSTFMTYYDNTEHEMSPEVYDRAVFVVTVLVPFVAYIAMIVAFVFCMAAAFDWARGRRGVK